MKDIKSTRSICPECLKPLDATIYRTTVKFSSKNMLSTRALYRAVLVDYDQYMRAEKFRYDGMAWRTRTEKNSVAQTTAASAPNIKATRL